MSIRKAINRFFEVHEAAWEIFMIILAVIFVLIGFLPDWMHLSTTALTILTGADWGITILFILEFIVRFWAAYSRRGYLKNTGWIYWRLYRWCAGLE